MFWKDAEYGGYYENLDNAPAPQLISEEQDNFSGLYDAEGNPLLIPKRKIGFF